MDPVVEALRRLIGDNDVHQRQAVADRIGANEQTLYQIIRGIPLPSGRPRSVGRHLREKLDHYYPGWLEAGANQAHPPTVGTHHGAQTLRFEEIRPLTWERLEMTKPQRADMPAVFQLMMHDDSMAPRVKAGATMTFRRDEVERPGDGVLVRDAGGNLYFRQYRPRRPDVWEAHAINPDVLPLESGRDGLVVLGVLVGLEARWG